MDFVNSARKLLEQPPTDSATKQDVLAQAYAVIQKLETPHDQVQRILYSNVKLPVVAAAADMGIIQTLGGQPGKQHTTEDLATGPGADTRLAARILRFLATNNIIDQHDADVWSGNIITQELSTTGNINGIYHQLHTMGPAYQKLPHALKKGKYQNLVNPSSAPFIEAHGIPDGGNPFQWLGGHPENLAYFTEFLKVHSGKGKWLDTSLKDELVNKSKTCRQDQVLFVDVGGSTGQYCVDVVNKIGDSSARVVNQDLPSVIVNKIEHQGVEHQEHDFFEEQPIKGARVYYLSNILHDWPDVESSKILKRVSEAMDQDSEIWLQEQVVPVLHAPEFGVNQDFTMMVSFWAAERTDRDWEALLKGSNLSLKRIESIPDAGRKIIIAELAKP